MTNHDWLLAEGFVEEAGLDEDGEMTYRVTSAGEAALERLFAKGDR